MIVERMAHVVTDDGFTYAVGLEGDRVCYAITADDPDHSLLNAQVCEAIKEWDMDQIALCGELTEMLAYGYATIIGTYFTVNA